MKSLDRRHMLGGLGSIALLAMGRKVYAQVPAPAGQGLLKKLQADKKVRVGIANNAPYSSLEPDGTISGLAPDVTKIIMTRLGIPEIEGFLATYGELIPGMMAGRWDFVSAAQSITKARCAQVQFADPMVFDGDNIVALKGRPGPQPKLLGDLAKGGYVVGLLAGGADLKRVLDAGIPQANIRQFESDTLMVDGLVAKRADFVIMTPLTLGQVLQQRNGLELETVYPVADVPPNGASCAFRVQDTDLHTAYQTELRAMKASGELAKIVENYGFQYRSELMTGTIEELCSK
jgi:polar amino acid transport system substrate-binding protein